MALAISLTISALPLHAGVLLELTAWRTAVEEPPVQLKRYIAHPYVATAPDFFKPEVIPGTDAIQFQDLRGVECYAQPDCFAVCGSPDTIAILLFTKSVTPIQDIEVRLNFSEGLEAAGFAYIFDGPAELDTISENNSEAPVFRISELSQGGGGVVVYIGARAQCEIDLANAAPSVTYTLDYESGGQSCTSQIDGATYSTGSIAVPEVVFDAAAFPITATIDDLSAAGEGCLTVPLRSLSAKAAASGIQLTLSDYGFTQGVSLSSVSPGTFTTDPITGQATIILDGDADGTLFGGDGLFGTDDGQQTVDVCFTIAACPAQNQVTPQFSLTTSCAGAQCSNDFKFAEGTVNVAPTFNAQATMSFTKIQDFSYCNASGDTQPYIYEVTMTSTVADPIRGDLYRLLHFIDACDRGILIADNAVVLDGPGGTPVGVMPANTLTQSSSGRIVLRFHDLPAGTDIDGPGVGLADLDGDGVFDDLPAGERITFRVELNPSCADGTASCSNSDDFATCDVTRHFWQGRRDCDVNGFTSAQNIDDGTDQLGPSQSVGAFDNLDMTPIAGLNVEEYNFGVFGILTPGGTVTSSTKTVEFDYTLDPTDFNSCSAAGDLSFELVLSGVNDITSDVVFSNIMVDGNLVDPATDTTDQRQVGSAALRIINVITDGGPHTISVDLTLDTAYCTPANLMSLTGTVVESCVGCTCNAIRACDAAQVRYDSENRDLDCTTSFRDYTLERISRGYTDRTLSNQLEADDVAAGDELKVLPGDTMMIRGFLTVEDPIAWNSLNRSFQINMVHLQNGSGSRPNLTSRLDLSLARLQEIVLSRGGGATTFDLGAVPVPGDFSDNTRDDTGIIIGGSRAGNNYDPCAIHPGISSDDYITGLYVGNRNDYGDQNNFFIRFGLDAQFPSDQQALAALYDYIGGGFQLNDTIFVEYHIPIVSTPRTLANGNPSIQGAEIETGDFLLFPDGRSIEGGALSGNLLGSTSSGPRPIYTYIEPTIESTTTLEYTNDCDAVLVKRFFVGNLPDAACFANEFRPILGVEDLTIDVPMPYVYSGGATYQHGNLAAVFVEPDSTVGMTSTAYSGGTAFVPAGMVGQLIFIDAEKANGLRADNYFCWDTENDQDDALVGGSFPLLGIGLGTTAANPDFLEFRIPLQRACGTTPAGLPTAAYNASYSSLPDFNTPAYFCNEGQWYGGSENGFCNTNGLPSFYWPYDRDDAGNPHQLVNTEDPSDTRAIQTATPSGTAPVNYTANNYSITNQSISDGPGAETNTYSFNLDQDIPGGILVISTELAIDLQTIGGVAPTTAAMNDSMRIFTFDLGARTAGMVAVDLVTDLFFCGDARVCIEAVLGCPSNPAQAAVIAEILAGSGKACGGAPVCYQYLSGIAEVRETYNIPSPVTCGTGQQYSFVIQNIGGSTLFSPVPVFYFPAGITVSNFEYSLVGNGATLMSLPNPPNTGTMTVYGTANSYNAGDLPDVPEGSTLTVSFTGTTSCNYVFGNPLTAEFSAGVNCNQTYESGPVTSRTLTTAPQGTEPAFTVNSTTNDINCSDGGGTVILTSVNAGKGPAGQTSVCLNLPAGVTVAESGLRVIAPPNFDIDDFMTAPLGAGQQVTFSGPQNGPVGAIFCVEVDFMVGNVDCGPIDVGYNLKIEENVPCSPDDCGPAEINAAGAGLITFNVVPEAGDITADITVGCSPTAGQVSLDYQVDIQNGGASYTNKPVTVEVFFDIDGDGMVGPDDTSLNTSTQNISLLSGTGTTITGSFDVDMAMACAVVMRIESPACSCSETFIAFDRVVPGFINDLGATLTVCPGESVTIGDVCLDLDYVFSPPGAGTVDESVPGQITLMIADGQEGIPTTLTASGALGNCGTQSFSFIIQELEDFDYGPFTANLCQTGCQVVDLDVPLLQQEDLTIAISPATNLTDATSFEPEICDPVADVIYDIEFSIAGGNCITSTTLMVTTVAPPAIQLAADLTGCSSGFRLQELATITPATLDGMWSSRGDGVFVSSPRFSQAVTYAPGPQDLTAGQVELSLRTDNPTGPCGTERAFTEFTILLVDCGTFPWNGND